MARVFDTTESSQFTRKRLFRKPGVFRFMAKGKIPVSSETARPALRGPSSEQGLAMWQGAEKNPA